MKYAIVYNATNFVSANISEILRTLAITLVLVVLVVFIFLQDWRATVIPTVAIPGIADRRVRSPVCSWLFGQHS